MVDFAHHLAGDVHCGVRGVTTVVTIDFARCQFYEVIFREFVLRLGLRESRERREASRVSFRIRAFPIRETKLSYRIIQPQPPLSPPLTVLGAVSV